MTEGVLCEFLRVSTHPKVFPSPLVWRESQQFLRVFVDADNVRVLAAEEGRGSLLGDILAELTHPGGNLFFDVRRFVLVREHGVRRIYTTDTDCLQFVGIEVVNPIRN